MSLFNRLSIIQTLNTTISRFKFNGVRNTDHSLNTHRSNRAKNGLFHGKDIRSGYNVSHSKAHTLRKWYPNVLNKRVFSYALNDFVRFKMTAAALKIIDKDGGIDNYLLNLDEKSVSDSQYITKMRNLISSNLFYKGELNEKYIKKLKYDKIPPPTYEKLTQMYDNYKKKQLIPKQQPLYKQKIEKMNQTL